MTKRKGSAGGAALHGGAAYQNRVAAWIAVEMLSEGSAAPLTAAGKLDFIRGETLEQVDDLLVGTSSGRYVFLQAKRRISLSDKSKSEFASVIDQAVRQVTGTQTGNQDPWSRALGVEDRIVLVTSSAATKEIKEALRDLLRRIARLAPGQPLASAAVNAPERKALKAVTSQIARSWKAETGKSPTDKEVKDLLALFSVEILDVADDQVNMREAKRTLEQIVLERPSQSGGAWSTIIDACSEMAQNRSGLDMASLQTKLLDNGISLRTLRSYRDDIERLRSHTQITISWLRDLSQIELAGNAIHLDRAVIRQLKEAVEKVSHVVVGQPGAGKSGALHDLVQLLQAGGSDVVCFATDRLELSSLFNLRSEIGLDHDVTEVLTNWKGAVPGYLVIDALDAARGDAAEQALLALLRTIVKSNTRWRIVASIRKFDLRYSAELQQLFRYRVVAGIAPAFLDPEFSSVQHVNIPSLSSDELSALRSSGPALHQMYEDASDEFRELLRVPFNLRLAAELLDSGVQSIELAPIRTQLELLNRYWQNRVLQGEGADDRESVLRRAVARMVQNRQLKIERTAVLGQGSAAALQQLLSSHILAEWQPAPARRPDRYSLAFAHNLLFDYACSQLFLPKSTGDVVSLLGNDQDLVLVIRPSIILYSQETWEQDRDQFWELTFAFCTSPTLSQLVQSVPLLVAASNARMLDDLQPLISALCSKQPGAEAAFQHLVGVLRSRPKLFLPIAGPRGGPWSAFVFGVVQCLTSRTIAYTQAMVELLLQEDELTWDQRRIVGAAARRILEEAWNGS
jgi:hypothetical protein